MKVDCFWWIVFGLAAYPKMDKKRPKMAKMGKMSPEMAKPELRSGLASGYLHTELRSGLASGVDWDSGKTMMRFLTAGIHQPRLTL